MIEHQDVSALRPAAPVEVDEGAARRTLRGQIARLESELAGMIASAPKGFRPGRPAPLRSAHSGAHLPTLAELEARRDELAERTRELRVNLGRRTAAQEQARVRLEQMLLEPHKHKFARVANADLGDGGCGVWEVRPRLGLIGMLAGWWEVRLSSGCPLATGPSGGTPERAKPQCRPSRSAHCQSASSTWIRGTPPTWTVNSTVCRDSWRSPWPSAMSPNRTASGL
ncbi:MAG TPA: hypothetical protein VHX88_07405 [Solirubrobacteraceae bacterium]|nr:hypothetical protein [Solirubrobacteraceae bacterium]